MPSPATMLKAITKLIDNGFPAEEARRVISSVDDESIERVASGVLPVDEASRTARAKAKGMDLDTSWYHTGFNPEINRIDTGNYPFTDQERPMFFSDDPVVSATYDANNDPQEFLLRTGLLDQVDAGGKAWNQLRGLEMRSPSGELIDIPDRPYGWRGTDDYAEAAKRYGSGEGVLFNNLLDLGGNISNAKRVAKQVNPDADIKDLMTALEANKGGKIAALNNKDSIKSKWALFDPEYTGPNVYGSMAGMGVLGALLAEQEKKRGMD